MDLGKQLLIFFEFFGENGSEGGEFLLLSRTCIFLSFTPPPPLFSPPPFPRLFPPLTPPSPPPHPHPYQPLHRAPPLPLPTLHLRPLPLLASFPVPEHVLDLGAHARDLGLVRAQLLLQPRVSHQPRVAAVVLQQAQRLEACGEVCGCGCEGVEIRRG